MSSSSSYKSRSPDSVRDRRSRSPLNDISSNTCNPKSKNSRIFVGNVIADKVSPEELKDRFLLYGKISGISIHKGFAFVQFDRPDSAVEAIKHEDKTMLKGCKIDVKPAVVNDSDRSRRNGNRSRSPDRGSRERDDRRYSSRDRSPVRDRSPLPPRGHPEDRYKYSDGGNRYGSRDQPRRRFDEPYPSSRQSELLDPGKPNDCEIIVTLKDLRVYAEAVERRLKNLGLTVDLLFLRDIAAMLPTIDNIARKGSMFAIVIADQNETHRSVTLNILHGTPQEHRNMPLDDAMKLVALKYHEYVQGRRDKMMKGIPNVEMVPPPSVSTPAVIPPGRSQKIHNLLNLLVEGKYLTSAELEAVINYLQDQRNEILARERGDHLKDPKSDPAWQFDATKISAQVPVVAPPQNLLAPSTSKPSGSFLNFDNPTVQKALDNLIQSGPNLLQSVLGTKSEEKPKVPIEAAELPPPQQSAPPSSQQYTQPYNQYQGQQPNQFENYQQYNVKYNRPQQEARDSEYGFDNGSQFDQNQGGRYDDELNRNAARHPLLGMPVGGSGNGGNASASAARYNKAANNSAQPGRISVLERNLKSSRDSFY